MRPSGRLAFCAAALVDQRLLGGAVVVDIVSWCVYVCCQFRGRCSHKLSDVVGVVVVVISGLWFVGFVVGCACEP